MFKKLLIVTLFFLSFIIIAQNKERKTIATTRVETAPKIDGNLLDEAWEKAEIANDFVVFKPDNGKRVSSEYASEVKIVYDDEAIYISAKMLDPEPSKIPQQFSTRDNLSQADFFLVTINTNDDGQNGFEFIVESTGNQADAKISNGNEDFNWSAVWQSEAKITDYGWNVEIKLPYRCIRFTNEPNQSWGFNFHRKLERLNSQYTWNYINNSIGIWTQHDGLITGFKNIKPPTRLNLYPYASLITKNFNGKTDFDWNVGMDIKYGVSDNFTLDATLIPDFSQAGFDNVSLNLGPFEQRFTEQRQFFTEGTELFTKGDLFYSRRIGGKPINSIELSDDESFIKNPEKVNMLNAVKISGRTKGGLGLGFFNAITEKTEATITNTTTNETRTETTNPFSNYNILVADYQFNKNSAITLINTNVTRDGSFKDANATGLLWHVETKDSKYNIDGAFKITNITDVDTPTTGYMFDTSIGKGAGNWFWELGYNFENKDYDPNDMGILFSNNRQRIYGNIGYKILKPFKNFNQLQVNFWNNAQFQHYSGMYTGYRCGINAWAALRSRFSFGGNLNYFTERKDFFEPRHSKGSLGGIYFKRPEGLNLNSWLSTNYQNKLAVDFNFYQTVFKKDKRHSYGFELKPRYRFSNQFSIIYGFKYNQTSNDRGFVEKEDDENIYFGQRNRTNYNNTLSGKYSFSTISALSLSFRHNWSKVKYDGNYYTLVDNGVLNSNTNYKGTDNINYNSWNIDLNYQWQFAPGSQLVALYRNSINSKTDFASTDFSFTDNLNVLFNEKMQHTFSLRMVYFLDYNQLKNIF